MLDLDFLNNHHAILIEIKRDQINNFIENLIYDLNQTITQYNIQLIEPDGKFIKKDQIQQLKKSLTLTSINDDSYYIIKNADKMNPPAFNSMLKFLEEPPTGVHAILVTSDINSVPETIKSRCIVEKVNEEINKEKISYADLEAMIFEKNYIAFKKTILALYKEKEDLKILEDILYAMLEKTNNKLAIIKIINDLKYNINVDLLIDKIYLVLIK